MGADRYVKVIVAARYFAGRAFVCSVDAPRRHDSDRTPEVGPVANSGPDANREFNLTMSAPFVYTRKVCKMRPTFRTLKVHLENGSALRRTAGNFAFRTLVRVSYFRLADSESIHSTKQLA
jgi:hypothetical protein